MKIRVLFFAELKEIFGAARFMEVSEGASVRETVNQLTASSDKFSNGKWPLVYAVNEEFETADKKLKEGDHLAVMMPMSGG